MENREVRWQERRERREMAGWIDNRDFSKGENEICAVIRKSEGRMWARTTFCR